MCESCSPNCDLVLYCAYVLIVLAVWDHSKFALYIFVYIYIYIYIFVCCRSETERRLMQYYCLLCSPGLGPAVFETWVVLGTRGRVLPNFLFAIFLYRVSGVVALRLAVMGGWRLLSSFENSWPRVAACSHTLILQFWPFYHNLYNFSVFWLSNKKPANRKLQVHPIKP